MANYLSGKRASATLVEGVLQYEVPLASNEADLLLDEHKTHLNAPDSELARNWLTYCARKLWNHRITRAQQRFGILCLEESATESELRQIDVYSLLDTAINIGVINTEEGAAVKEAIESRATDKILALKTSYRISSVFWGIHYIDYHLNFLRGALYYKILDEQTANSLKEELLKLDPLTCKPDVIRDLFDKVTKDATVYSRIARAITQINILFGDKYLDVFSEKSLYASLSQLSFEDKFLAPGFESRSTVSQAWLTLEQLKNRNAPSILVDVLLGVASYGRGLSQGNVIKTHALFPGEKAVVTLESYSKEATTFALTSSVLDNTSVQAESDFSSELSASTSESSENSHTNSFSAGVDVKASWGWGSGGADVKSSQSATSVAKRAVSNAEKALRSQASKVSNNRTVKVETTSTSSFEKTQRQSLVRTIENINVSKPLNFVFRQLIQNVLSLVLIRDLRISAIPYLGADPITCSLEQLPDVLRTRVFSSTIDEATLKKIYHDTTMVARNIAFQDLALDNPSQVDFLTQDSDISEQPQPRWKATIPRGRVLNMEKAAVFHPNDGILSAARKDEEESEVIFDGVLLECIANFIKTEGVHVECYLSENEGLDSYSQNLQLEAARQKHLINATRETLLNSMDMARCITLEGKTTEEKATLFERLVVPTLNSIVKNNESE